MDKKSKSAVDGRSPPESLPLGPERIEEFDRLVREHRHLIYRVAYRMTGNSEDAQDLVQETLVKAYRAFAHFELGSHFDRWVCRIMYGIHIDILRKTRGDREVLSLDAPVEGEVAVVHEVADRSTDPAWQLEQREFSEPVQAALDSLPEVYRTAVVLCDVEGFTYEDVSHLLGCPIGTIRSRLHRARSLLRERLKPYLETRE